MTIDERSKELEALLESYGGKIRAGVFALITPRQEAEDVVSEIYLALWTALPNFRGESLLGTYVYSITRFKVRDYLRRKYRELELQNTAHERAALQPAAGEDVSPPEDLKLSSLHRREIDVLRLVARGRKNEEIAGALFISENTVRTHLKKIYKKLGARSRVEAALVFNRCAAAAGEED